MSRFEVFVGIDQTGATYPGKPHRVRPLPCAWFTPRTRKLHLCKNGIDHFEPRSLRSAIGCKGGMAVLLDCVIGLPDPFGAERFEKCLRDLARLESRHPLAPFGREPAEAFFRGLLESRLGSQQDPIPTRTCERLAGANSVFRSRPYQRNIQTGTYRLWREISRARGEMALWPFDTAGSFTVFEGFPSLLWRELLGLHSRKGELLARHLKKLGAELTREQASLLREDPDLADAAVLAVGGWVLHGRGMLDRVAHEAALREGWIAGLEAAAPLPIPKTSKVVPPHQR